MNTSNQRLVYPEVRAQYHQAFNAKPPSELVKSVSLMDGGTQELARAMYSAVIAGKALDFNNFAKQFFKSLAGSA